MANVRKKTEATPAVYLFRADMGTVRRRRFDFQAPIRKSPDERHGLDQQGADES